MNYKDVYLQTISDPNWRLPFGKWKGETIRFLIENEPQYLQWCIEKGMFELDHILQDEFENFNPWRKNEPEIAMRIPSSWD